MAPDTSTWGGHPVFDPITRVWHGYFAEMTNHCGLDSWTTNSVTVHATSSRVTGPFKFERIVQPAWSHNPLVALDPVSGDVLIAHIGCGTIAKGHSPRNCSGIEGGELLETATFGGKATRETAKHPAPPSLSVPPCECSAGVGACQTLQVLRARAPEGPFVDATVAWPLTNTSAWPSCMSNPTLLVATPGAVPPQQTLLGFNGNLAPPHNHGPTSHPGLLVSRGGDWAGPYDLANRTVPGSGTPVHYLEDHGYVWWLISHAIPPNHFTFPLIFPSPGSPHPGPSQPTF